MATYKAESRTSVARNLSTSDDCTEPGLGNMILPRMADRPSPRGVGRHASEMKTTFGLPVWTRANCTLSRKLMDCSGLRVASDSSQYSTYSTYSAASYTTSCSTVPLLT